MDNIATILPGKIFLLEIFETSGNIELNTTFCSYQDSSKVDHTNETDSFRPCIHPEDYTWLVDRFKSSVRPETDAFQFFARLRVESTPQSEPERFIWHFFTVKILRKDQAELPARLLCIAVTTENIVNHERKFETYIQDASFIRANQEKFFDLTFREKEVLHLLSKGFTNRQASLQLGISEQTVKTHRKKVVKKLQTANPMELANYLVFFE